MNIKCNTCCIINCNQQYFVGKWIISTKFTSFRLGQINK